MKFKRDVFEVSGSNNGYYIGIGLKIEDWTSIFYKRGIFTNKDVDKLRACIDKTTHLVINEQNLEDDLNFVIYLSEKILNAFPELTIKSDLKLPIKKEAFIFVSSSDKNGEIKYNYRAAMVRGLIAKPLNPIFAQDTSSDIVEKIVKLPMKSSHYERISSKKINVTPEVEDSLIIENNDLKKQKVELDKNANYIDSLLQKIEENNIKINEIQRKTTDLTSQLVNATGVEKTRIYEQHSKLTKELNLLLDKNEEIEIEQENNGINDINSLKVISADYSEKLRIIDEEIKNSESKINVIKEKKSSVLDSIQPRIRFTSGYAKINKHFEITNIIRKKSISKYESFYAVIFNLLNKGTLIKPSEIIGLQSIENYHIIYEYQMAILSLIRYGYLDDENWSFIVENKNLFNLAFKDIIFWTNHLCTLAQINYTQPNLSLNSENGYKITHDYYDFSTKVISVNYVKKENWLTDLWISDLILYKININSTVHSKILNDFLKWVFGFESFREGQLKIIQNFLNGHNTLGILPTGGGKSLTYYMGVLLQPKTSLVIAPINSLIIDQIDKITHLFGIDRFANITSSNKMMRDDLKVFAKGGVMFTFASPERAQNNDFRNILIKLNFNKTIGSVILDEVHCLSEWGHDFRVPYLMLSETLNNYCKGIRYLGLTATASINVVRDLLIELSIKEKDVITSEHMRRENLSFEINSFRNVEDAQFDLIAHIDKDYNTGKGLDISKNNTDKKSVIVFSQVKRTLDTSVEKLYDKISSFLQSKHGYRYNEEIAMYTGDAKDSQEAFMNDEKTLLIATKAFGMGIDKPNIRMTVHFGMPSSREAFYQEAGRAGRDGKASKCLLYAINPNDFDIDSNVKRFLNPNTSVFDMKNILRFLTRKKVDIATAFYFFLDSYEEPEIEKNKSLIILERLKHHDNYKISLYNEDKKSTEKYLYILFKLGIVKNWTITYSSAGSDNFKNVDFDIDLNYKMNDINHIREQALKYVQAYQSDDEKYITESEQLFYNKINNTDVNQLGDLILEMRKWYHSLFITTRREQIANMYQMIKDFANKGPTIEIQNVIDRFFNIKDSIGKTSEGFDLVTFEGATLEEVVNYAFLLTGEDLIQRKYEMQVVLQSNVNAKNSVYTSLIHLRLDEFKKEHNGDERFDYAFSLLNENERLEVIESIIINYSNLKETQKIMIIDKLKNYDQKIIHKLYEKFSDDQLVNEYAIAYINSKFDESWV